jgi:2-polyprenyl-6-hydroxyphenyl methylase/3-demethylubiquinone-9 3-methyltransferase
LSYNPLTQVYSLNDDVDVNYMIAVQKKWIRWITE